MKYRSVLVLGLALGALGCGAAGSDRSGKGASVAGAGGAPSSASGGAPSPGGSGGSLSLDVDDVPGSFACAEAEAKHASVGCEYFVTKVAGGSDRDCFAAFVANTSDGPARVRVQLDGAELPVGSFGYLPQGSGPSLSYLPLDADASIPPGQVAILFLSGGTGKEAGVATCPQPSAVESGGAVGSSSYPETWTGIGKVFRVASDVPVIAYQILPFGAGDVVHDAGATLLLPTSAWDTNYIAVNAYKDFKYGIFAHPSMNIVAASDDTEVTLLPVADVVGGGGIPAGPAGKALKFMLNRGEQAQIHQAAELTGSVVQASKPIGFIAGHPSLDIPGGDTFQGDADHGEQMIPPVRELGWEYVGVMHEPRATEAAVWRIVGAVSGTELTWSSDVGGPATLEQGTIAQFVSSDPFVVKSQDDEHPFILLQMMAGSGWNPNLTGRGGPEVVYTVPPQQYLSHYALFTDPTYLNTHLVVVRAKKEGAFADVSLDCAGVLGGWQPLGDYEWTRIRLNQGDPYPWGTPVGVGDCDTGRHELKSDAPFGVTVWGWHDTTSYGYPGGMGTAPINDVVIDVPR